jgi:hypothetical protein
MSDTAAAASGDAPMHLPSYITPPGETDVLFVAVTIFLVLAVFALGVFYFKLHALPEKMAHGSHRGQYQIVAILALVALFTHNNAFWIAALLLAAITPPDFLSPLKSIAVSLRKMSRATEPAPVAPAPPPAPPADPDTRAEV